MQGPVFRLALAALLSASALAQPAPGPAFRTGCQTFTFNHYTVCESIEKTAAAGGTVVEFYPGQPLSAADPQPMGPNLGDKQVEALRDCLKANRITAASCYTDIPKEEAPARQLFEFAKRLGLGSLTTESVESIDIIEKLAKEFDLRVGFHEHEGRTGDPNYKLWDPHFILELVKNRDSRIGACPDTGHWASSGVVPLDGVKLLSGRIINLHLKDRSAIGHPTTDVILGTGVSDISGILQELRKQKFNGCIFVEFEANWTNNVPDARQCLDFIRNSVTKPAGAK